MQFDGEETSVRGQALFVVGARVLALMIWSVSLAWLVGTTACAVLQPLRRRISLSRFDRQPITVLVPTCAIESPRSAQERRQTLDSLLDMSYPDYEIVVCIDRAEKEQRVRLDVESRFRTTRVRTTTAEHEASANPKIDAMHAGLRQAQNDLILFCDDDVSVDRLHLDHLMFHLNSAQLVSAAAFGVGPQNLWGNLECSFMNGQFAKLHLAGDCIGLSGALGKTVFIRRAELETAGGIMSAGADCCDDAALTRMVKKAGGHVVLSALPVRQLIGEQKLLDVLRRHRRWLSCRRKYVPLLFVAELLFSTIIAVIAGSIAAEEYSGEWLRGGAGTLLLWCLVDMLFAAWHGYLAWPTPLAWLIREVVFVPLWFSALLARTVTWYGRAVPISSWRLDLR
jgi:ceramide glucosyltransferase